jgi:hypothetical protein
MAEYYRLNADHSVTPISDPQEWAIAFEDRDKRRVAKTKLPDGTMISTVFLGLNHAYGDGPPMIFGPHDPQARPQARRPGRAAGSNARLRHQLPPR